MKSDKQTYSLTKDGVAMAFEGPREPVREPIEPRILPEDVWYINVYMPWKKEMELAKASALPLINETNVEWGKDGIFFFEGKKIKEGEVVPLEGWKVEKEYYLKFSTAYDSEDHKVTMEEYYKNLGFQSRQAYRLVRSEPEQKGETDHYCKDVHRMELSNSVVEDAYRNDTEVQEWLKTVSELRYEFASKMHDAVIRNIGTRGKMLIDQLLVEIIKKEPAAPVESQEELYEEVVNVIWNLGDNTSFKDCKNYLKENYTITRNEKKP